MVGPKPSVLRGIYDLISVYLDRGISRSSAALSYYLIFTFFPFLIMVNAVFSLVNQTPDAFFNLIQRYLPTDLGDLLNSYFSYVTQNNSIALLVASIAVILTSASAAFRIIMRVGGEIYQDRSLSSVVRMVISVIMPLVLILVLYLSLVILLTGTWFIHLIERVFSLSLHLDHWGWIRFLVMFCLIFLFLAALYRLTLPRTEKGKKRPPVLLGAFCSAIALLLASILFSYFISMSSKYSIVYGSLASLMILMLWLYLIANVIFLGNILNYVVYCHREAKRTGKALKEL
jgi:membrane protein